MVDEPLPSDAAVALGLDDPAGERATTGRVSKVWLAWRRGRRVAVRQSPWFRPYEQVAYEAEVLRGLHSRGAPVAAVVDGPIDLGATGVWTAFDCAPGGHPATPVDDPDVYGALLGRLHADAATLEIAQRPGWCRVDEFFTFPRGDGTLTLQSTIAEFAAKTGAAGARLRRFAEETHDRLAASSIENAPQLLAHGDFGPHQVLADGDRLTVIDWDFCHVDTQLADLAIATSLARPTADRARRMISAYLDTVRTDIGDLALLGDLRRAFHLNNLANQVCVLWVHGIDVDRQLAVITERLEREQWWAPTLRRATAPHDARGDIARQADHSSDLELAHALADRASIVAMHYFAVGVVAELKHDESPVTDADKAVEHLLAEALATERPDDGVLGEELGATAHARSGRRWILDPVDGTAAFAVADPNWRVQIALEDAEGILLAVVDEPANGRRWWATRGGGTYERGPDGAERPLEVSAIAELGDAVLAHHPPRVGERLPPHRPMQPRSPLPLVELIRGEIDAFYVECCQIWDHAPWVLLVEEAGGRFTDHDGGRSPDRRGGLYSNARLHDALWRAIDRAR